MKKVGLPVMIFILLGLFVTAFSQQMVEIVPSKDNTLFESNDGSLSNGQGAYLFTGRTNQGLLRRVLIEFDVAGNLPAGAIITEAELSLRVSKTRAETETVRLHRVTQEWGEGTSDAAFDEGAGATATINDATWLHTLYESQQWSSPGGDYLMSPSAEADVGGNGRYTWGSTAQLVADVQSWLQDPSSNHGWILIGDEDTNKSTKRFDSRENTTDANRPVLNITYTTETFASDRTGSNVTDYALYDNHPNPFNPATVISFQLATGGHANLTIFDVQGRVVNHLLQTLLNAGFHSVRWNGRDDAGQGLPSGVYYYRLASGLFKAYGNMLMLR